MKRLLLLLICTTLYAGCDSVNVTDEPEARPGEAVAEMDDAPAFAVMPDGPGPVERRRPRPDADECPTCTKRRGGPLTFDAQQGYQYTVTRVINGREVVESYVLALQEASERRVVLALYQLASPEPVCDGDEPVPARLVRTIEVFPRQAVGIVEVDIEVRWRGGVGQSPAGGPVVDLQMKPYPPIPTSTDPSSVPKPKPTDWFMCIFETPWITL